jgi:hypothetical protein
MKEIKYRKLPEGLANAVRAVSSLGGGGGERGRERRGGVGSGDDSLQLPMLRKGEGGENTRNRER